MKRKLIALLVSGAALIGFAVPASAQAPSASELLNFVVVTPESSGSSYSRSLFRHWSDQDRDGCNTREEVLLQESLVAITPGRSCRITRGRWYSEFDGRVLTSASSIDIDHFVPLKEAWESGASNWDASMREAFANDLDFAGSLIAVSASSNRSKSDRDPANWMPTNTSYLCTYAVTWLQIKYRWSLSADQQEVTALKTMLALCPTTENYELPALAAGVTAIPAPTSSQEPTQTPAPTETQSPTPSPTASDVLPRITAGAFCAKSAEGTQGRASNGIVYTCKTSATDSRLRWRR